jgi:hypothetical protein
MNKAKTENLQLPPSQKLKKRSEIKKEKKKVPKKEAAMKGTPKEKRKSTPDC